MKYGKKLLGAALAIGAISVAAVVLRPEAAAVKPEGWIVNAAIALNRDAITATPHGAGKVPEDRRAAALRAAHVGEQFRIQRKFAEAAAAYREAVEADPSDADAWADLADSAAAAAGKDLTAGRDAIERALAIDPHHLKALWLRASLELQEQRYPAAAATWRELRQLVAPGSADARVIEANIAEADALSRTVSVADGRGS
ncbi:MAG TPA: tetratricopeptide repeat protein [Vicinamibacterales bacterium]|nr:tetratricopeptide repeat protein [Vicinamibacterales bacterium]